MHIINTYQLDPLFVLLQSPQLGIYTLRFDKRVVVSLLDHATLSNDNNTISIDNGGNAVGDN